MGLAAQHHLVGKHFALRRLEGHRADLSVEGDRHAAVGEQAEIVAGRLVCERRPCPPIRSCFAPSPAVMSSLETIITLSGSLFSSP